MNHKLIDKYRISAIGISNYVSNIPFHYHAYLYIGSLESIVIISKLMQRNTSSPTSKLSRRVIYYVVSSGLVSFAVVVGHKCSNVVNYYALSKARKLH